MNHHLEKNCEGVDASVFSGDVLYDDESRNELKEYIGRWTRAIAEHEGAAVQAAQPEAVGLCERICEAIKAADDKSMNEAGYMLDSTDCIAIVRQQFASAPTEPMSAPTAEPERSEREAFEAWMRSIGKTDRDLQCDGWNNTGEYSWITERSMWQAWQARALSAPTAPAQAEPRKPDDVDLLLRAVFELCEATEEAPEVAPRNEHQRGFDKGRRFEAKGIRRAVGDWFQATFCGQSFMGEPVIATPPSAATPEPSDAERLDWLETADWAMVQDQLQLWFDLPTCWKPATVRAAIDAAIRATKGGKL